VSAFELTAFLQSINTFSSSKNRKLSLQVVHLHNGQDHLGPYMNVFNSLTQSMRTITEALPLKRLAELVLLDNKADTSRGNKYIDTGFSADHNQKRVSRHGGVATPNALKRTITEHSAFHIAMLGMTSLLDHVCQPDVKGKVFVDADREAHFAGTIVAGNRIEALRVALTNSNNILSCHVDDKNDTSENFKGVINFSKWLFLSDGKWWRLSVIGYSRKSVAGSLRRIHLYTPLVTRIVHFYECMPPDRKSITPSLLSSSNFHTPDCVYRLKPHADKCVFYSVFVDCLTRLQGHLHLSVWHVLALVTNTIVSETPDYFHQVSQILLHSKGATLKKYRSLAPTALALEFYAMIFDEKERRHKKGIKVPGQRHQPHYNGRQRNSVVVKSIHNFFCLYRAFEHLDSKLASDSHFYGKAIAYMEDGYLGTGVFGAGPLTAQHLVHIGALCGLFPPEMLAHAEIGESTNSYKYLRRWEGMIDYQEDTRQLLACVSHKLHCSQFVAENIICKFGQDQTTAPPRPKSVPNLPMPKLQSLASTSKRGSKTRKERAHLGDVERVWKTKASPYRDSIYPFQFLYFLDKQLNLVQVTPARVDIVDPLSSLCAPSTQPELPVPFSYWQMKVKSKRTVPPMKGCTRSHLKFLLAPEHLEVGSEVCLNTEGGEDNDEDDDELLATFAKQVTLVALYKTTQLSAITLSSRSAHSTHTELPVPISYWQMKVKSKRAETPIKGCTRSDLKRLLAHGHLEPHSEVCFDSVGEDEDNEDLDLLASFAKQVSQVPVNETTRVSAITPKLDKKKKAMPIPVSTTKRRPVIQDINPITPRLNKKKKAYKKKRPLPIPVSIRTKRRRVIEDISEDNDWSNHEEYVDTGLDANCVDDEAEWLPTTQSLSVVQSRKKKVAKKVPVSEARDDFDEGEEEEEWTEENMAQFENGVSEAAALAADDRRDGDGVNKAQLVPASEAAECSDFKGEEAAHFDNGTLDTANVKDDDQWDLDGVRMHLILPQVAMQALHFPPVQKKFLVRETVHFPPEPGHSFGITMVAAHLSFPTGPNRPKATWFPSPDLGPDLIAAFSPGSVIAPDGKRYHATRCLATTYLYIAAILEGDAKFVSRVLAPKRCLDMAATVMVEQRQGTTLEDSRPLGVISSHPSSPGHNFSFVNASGVAIGKRLSSHT
jgi:hypothetical protein